MKKLFEKYFHGYTKKAHLTPLICALCKVYFFSAQKNFFQCREKRYGVHSKKNGERKNREKQVKFFPKSLISPIKKCNFAPGKIWIPYYSYSGSHSFQSTPTPSLYQLYTKAIPTLYQVYSTLGFPPS